MHAKEEGNRWKHFENTVYKLLATELIQQMVKNTGEITTLNKGHLHFSLFWVRDNCNYYWNFDAQLGLTLAFCPSIIAI